MKRIVFLVILLWIPSSFGMDDMEWQETSQKKEEVYLAENDTIFQHVFYCEVDDVVRFFQEAQNKVYATRKRKSDERTLLHVAAYLAAYSEDHSRDISKKIMTCLLHAGASKVALDSKAETPYVVLQKAPDFLGKKELLGLLE